MEKKSRDRKKGNRKRIHKRDKFIILLSGTLLSLFGYIFFKYTVRNNETVMTAAMPTNKKVVIIDAGHGGWDPGLLITDNGVDIREADLNLKVALKLQELLVLGGATTFMTRAEDVALGETKALDMKARVGITGDETADIFISIHQNRYEQESVKGAQVFYYADSTAGETLAKFVQDRIKTTLDPKNKREILGSKNYYILEKSTCPAILVECGFLSNMEERKKLMDDAYQDKLAFTIYAGIVEYFAAMR